MLLEMAILLGDPVAVLRLECAPPLRQRQGLRIPPQRLELLQRYHHRIKPPALFDENRPAFALAAVLPITL
jgi:hypothetical protein